MEKSKGYPGDEVVAAHCKFITSYWLSLSAFAVAGWKDNGPGMVLVQESSFINLPAVVRTIQMAYMPVAELIAANAIGETERAWLAEGDFARILVVGVIRADSGFSIYRVDGVGEPTPRSILD